MTLANPKEKPQACFKNELKFFLKPFSPRTTGIVINEVISENRGISLEEAKNEKIVTAKEVEEVLKRYDEL